jgi:hypothetical protein
MLRTGLVSSSKGWQDDENIGAAHDLLAAIPQPCATPIKPTCKSAAIAMQPISAVWLAFVASVSRGNHRRTYAPGS